MGSNLRAEEPWETTGGALQGCVKAALPSLLGGAWHCYVVETCPVSPVMVGLYIYLYMSSKKGCKSWADDDVDSWDTWDNFLVRQILCLFGLQEHELCRGGFCQAAFSVAEPSPEETCGQRCETNCAWVRHWTRLGCSLFLPSGRLPVVSQKMWWLWLYGKKHFCSLWIFFSMAYKE